MFGSARAREVLSAFRDLMNGAPEELGLACGYVNERARVERIGNTDLGGGPDSLTYL